MQANTPWEMLPSRQRTRSAPRNWTRFAAQYLARGLPCERFTAALASRNSCITRGRGGWLNPSPWGTSTSYSLPASWRTPFGVKLRRTECEHMFSALPSNSDVARCIRHVSKVPEDDLTGSITSTASKSHRPRLHLEDERSA